MRAHLVGIVLLSHSRTLAEGSAHLAGQLAGGQVTVFPVGGTDDGGLGTSPDRLAAAVRAADQGAGVVVIPDLGSAVLASKALLVDLAEDEPDLLERIRIADAPFVEGAVAAVVSASAGLDLAAVLAAAEEARDVHKF
jgi:phosphoenolpyruvate---glycerone phosphotransferase subunit DhaM